MPSEEQTYRKSIDDKLDIILDQVKYTNGKVRRITIALVLLGGILIGQTFTTTKDIIQLFAGVIH